MKLEIQEAAKNKSMREGLGFIAVCFGQLIKQQFRLFLKKIGGLEKGRSLCRHCTIHLFTAWLSVFFWQENGLDVWQNTTLPSVHIIFCG
jgi:hypothetical protein